MLMPKIDDSLETIREINSELFSKYNRYHVLEDKNFILDPTIDPMSYFSRVQDIDGNMETTFKVELGFEKYVLQKIPKYVWETEDEYLKEQFNKWTETIEVSYDLQDLKIPNICKIHHIFIKRNYSPRYQKFYYCVWVLKEHFEGDSLLWFDYGAKYPHQHYNTSLYGEHKPNKLVSLKAAKEFSKEIISVYIQLLSNGYFPHRYDDKGIIISYDVGKDKINWRYVDYTYCRKKNPNSDEIRFSIDIFKVMLHRICIYTNHNTDESSKYYNSFFGGLYKLFEEKSNFFSNIGQEEYQRYNKEGLQWNQNWPIQSENTCVEVFTTFLNYVSS